MAFKESSGRMASIPGGKYIKAPRGREHCSAERLYSLTVVVDSGPQKEVAPLCGGMKHCKLNLIILGVSTL